MFSFLEVEKSKIKFGNEKKDGETGDFTVFSSILFFNIKIIPVSCFNNERINLFYRLKIRCCRIFSIFSRK